MAVRTYRYDVFNLFTSIDNIMLIRKLVSKTVELCIPTVFPMFNSTNIYLIKILDKMHILAFDFPANYLASKSDPYKVLPL